MEILSDPIAWIAIANLAFVVISTINQIRLESDIFWLNGLTTVQGDVLQAVTDQIKEQQE